MVQCAEDAECCPYDDTAIQATLEVITGKQKRINTLEKEIRIRQAKLDEIANECPTEWAEMEADYRYVSEESKVDVLPPVSGQPMGTTEVVETVEETTEEIVEESSEVIEEFSSEEIIEESSEVIEEFSSSEVIEESSEVIEEFSSETVVEEFTTTEEIITVEEVTTEDIIEADPEAPVEGDEVLTNEDPAHIVADEE